jgi:dienelactone hydrolase
MLLSTLLGLCAPTAGASGPTTRRAPAANGWDASWFDYAPAEAAAVEFSTPTKAQVSFSTRPPQKAEEPVELRPGAADEVKPVTIEGVDILRLRFRDAGGEIVPALLCTPHGQAGPFPVVVAVHGLGSNKAQVVGQVAPALTKRGFAVLAPDMPLHGERPGSAQGLLQRKDFITALARFRQCVMNVRQTIDIAQTLPQLETSRGVVLAGYSMGALVHSLAGPADERVRAMVLMVGGAHEIHAAARLLPQLAATDPRLAIANFIGRPLLMLNARYDSTITPEMGTRLFDAAAEPKEQRWYESGHRLPAEAYEDAAEWVEQTWAEVVTGG